MKAATKHAKPQPEQPGISIHAAREGGDYSLHDDMCADIISIHAAREGGDPNASAALHGTKKFQSTPPVKAATHDLAIELADRIISIHAAREGGDCGNE